MRFREAKEAGLDHLPASYVGAKHLNQRKPHFINGIDLREKKLDSDIQITNHFGRIEVHLSRFISFQELLTLLDG